jgi:hypothetical protein
LPVFKKPVLAIVQEASVHEKPVLALYKKPVLAIVKEACTRLSTGGLY